MRVLGTPLFSSTTKFDSGTGWPSFFKPLAADVVEEHDDGALFMRPHRGALRDLRGDLGHVFADGSKPTGQRYGMNGTALAFVPDGLKPEK